MGMIQSQKLHSPLGLKVLFFANQALIIFLLKVISLHPIYFYALLHYSFYIWSYLILTVCMESSHLFKIILYLNFLNWALASLWWQEIIFFFLQKVRQRFSTLNCLFIMCRSFGKDSMYGCGPERIRDNTFLMLDWRNWCKRLLLQNIACFWTWWFERHRMQGLPWKLSIGDLQNPNRCQQWHERCPSFFLPHPQ